MRYFFSLFFLFSCITTQAQIFDNFDRALLDDTGLEWQRGTSSGVIGDFFISNNTLQAVFDKGSGTRKCWISTAIPDTSQTYIFEWEFEVKIDFGNLSSSLSEKNKARIYLTASQADLNGELSGYFIACKPVSGEQMMTCQLYQSQGNDEILLATEHVLEVPTFQFATIHVKRDEKGKWEIWVNDHYQGSVNDNELPVKGFFGGQVFFSSGSREDKFFFDNFSVIKYPYLDSIKAFDQNSVNITFSVPIDSLVSVDPANYLLNGEEKPETIKVNRKSVTLFFASPFIADVENQLDISNISDIYGNALPVGDTLQGTFTFSVPDLSPPKVLNVKGLQDSLIIMQFDEAILESSLLISNILLIESGASPLAITKDTAHSFVLYFEQDFILDSTYQLTVSGVEDVLGNVLQDTLIIDFTFKDRLPPQVVNANLINSNTLLVTFSESLDSLSMVNATNYRVSDDLQPVKVLQEKSNQARLVFSQEFIENEEIEIQVSYVEDVSNNSLLEPWKGIFMYDTEKPSVLTGGDGVFPISDTVLQVVFTEVVDSLSARIVNNYRLKNDFGEYYPDSISIDSDIANVVYLFFKLPFESEKEYSLRVVEVSDLAGNLMNTRTRSFYYDVRPPFVSAVKLFPENRLLITFNEPPLIQLQADTIKFKLAQNYPYQIYKFYESNLDYWLYFDSLVLSDSLPLIVNGIVDYQGNAMLQADTFYINTTNPQITALYPLSKNTLEGIFSMSIDSSWLHSNALFNIDEKIYPDSMSTDANIVQLSFSHDWQQDSIYQLHIDSLLSKTGTLSYGLSSIFTFQKGISSVYIKDDYQVVLNYNRPILRDSLRVDQFLLNGKIPIEVFADEAGEVINLLFENVLLPDSLYTLEIKAQLQYDGKISPQSNFNFSIDEIEPVLQNVFFSDFNEITLQFNEALAENLATAFNHFVLSLEQWSIKPSAITLNKDSIIILQFENDFLPESTYELTFQNIQDLAGNTLFNKTVALTFPSIPAKGDIIINEIMADPTPVQGLPEAEFIELLNTSSKKLNLFHVYLEDVSGTFHLGNKELEAGETIILCDVDFQSQFQVLGSTFAMPSFPSITNSGEKLSLSNSQGAILDEVHFEDDWHTTEKKAGGWSIERIIPFYTCREADNWRSSIATLGGSPGQVNSVKDIVPDTVLPMVTEYWQYGENTIYLTFSEEMDTVLNEDENYFKLNDNEVFIEPLWKSKDTLTFTYTFAEGNITQLQVSNFTDCAGNTMLPDTLEFINGKTPNFHELFFTEIMADPSPSVGLAEVEYLEIYNTTSQLIDLTKCTLSDGTSTTALSGYILPKSYLVLCNANNAVHFQNVLPLSSLPSLNNSGEELVIKNPYGELVFHINYSDNWYKDSQKKEGGYSLEMIDVTFPCGGAENWIASENENGGTPGFESSVKNVITDNIPPYLYQVYMVDSLQMQLVFNEKMDSLSLVNAIYEIEPNIDIQAIEIPSDYAYFETRLTLAEPLQKGQPYNIRVKNVQDCSGNTMASYSSRIFILPEEAGKEDILLSEILFNPPPNGVDFVELYNASDKYIDLTNWSIGNGKGDISNISVNTQIIPPRKFLVLTADLSSFHTYYSKVADSLIVEMKLPSFNDDAGNVKLINDQGETVQEFSYDEDQHFRLLEDVEGVSLERIDYSLSEAEISNWHSAAASVGFATPGEINSQRSDLGRVNENCFSINPPIFSPDLDGVDDFVKINYACQMNGTVANVTIYNAQGRLVRRLIQNQTLADSGFFIWDGTKEHSEKVNMGYYLILIETFDLDGNTKTIKLKVAVGARF